MNKIYLLTGLPCSGKTTIGTELARKLGGELLDGDIIRTNTLNNDFSKEGRTEHIYQVAALAADKSRSKPIVIALVSPYKKVRDYLKLRYSNLIEVYVNCSLRECKKRDVKGMYAKAIAGEIKDFTGVDSKYEKPEDPDIIVDTQNQDVNQCVYNILNFKKYKVNYPMFIGRFQPFHLGHVELIKKLLEQNKRVLVAIRDTYYSENNPYSISQREEMIRKHFDYKKVICITIPDIEGIYYGRNVGYNIERIKLSKDIESISGTKIRDKGASS